MTDVELGYKPPARSLRDAVHVAVISMIAEEELRPGQRMEHGIVDPYLTKNVNKGEMYWICLYPNTVTGMRHHWSHPGFQNTIAKEMPSKEQSEQWLRDFCDDNYTPGFDIMIKAATGDYVEGHGYYGEAYELFGDCLIFKGTSCGGELPSEFWDHVENYTGQKCPSRPSHYSCSC